MNYEELLQHHKDQFDMSNYMLMCTYLKHHPRITPRMKRDLLKYNGEDKFFIVLDNGNIERLEEKQ